MSDSVSNANAILLKGILERDYSLIHKGIKLGAPNYDKTRECHKLLFNSWGHIIELNDMGLIEHFYKSYPFKNLHHSRSLLVCIFLNKKESFDFFLDKCIKNKTDLNDKSGVLLSNMCRKISPQSTYEEDFEIFFTSDYYLKELLKQNIDLNATTTHPLVLLAANNNLHSWTILYNHMKSQKNYNFEDNKKHIINSLYKFLDNNSFFSEEVQLFFNEFDKKLIFTQGLKKISNPSYKGKDLELFCLEMFSQEPEIFNSLANKLGKNNDHFSSTVQKILFYDKLNNKFSLHNDTSLNMKGRKI